MARVEQDPLNVSSSSGSSSSVDSLVKRQIAEDTWVQCENSSCLKWRRISKSISDDLTDAPWFCFMNSDQQYSSCNDQQEDYKQLKRLARKCRMKYVASTLEEGSLVWAKMNGFCRWPGIVCSDPFTGESVVTDEDEGYAQYYHVEFLGETHTRSWVTASKVEIFGVENVADGGASQKASCSGVGRGKRHSYKPSAKLRGKYKGNTVSFAEKEARQYIDLLPHERLDMVVFRSQEDVNESRELSLVRGKQPQKPKSCKKTRTITHRLDDNSTVAAGLGEESSCQQASKRRRGRKAAAKTVENESKKSKKPKLTVLEPTKFGRRRPGSRPAAVKQADILQGSSKEEQFALHTKECLESEAEFERSVKQFMEAAGLRMSKTPKWKDVKVSFYQLYSVVQDRGGYEQVCKKKQWSAVYRELTSFPIDSASIIRKFYKKNLLPYELFTRDEEYGHLVEEIVQSSPKMAIKDRNCAASRGRSGSSQSTTSSAEDCQVVPTVTSEDDEICSSSLNDSTSTFEALNAAIRRDCQRLNLNVNFYDSPQLLHLTPTRACDVSAQLPGETGYCSSASNEDEEGLAFDNDELFSEITPAYCDTVTEAAVVFEDYESEEDCFGLSDTVKKIYSKLS